VSHIRARPSARLTALSSPAVLSCILVFSSPKASKAQGRPILKSSVPPSVRCWTEPSATEVLPFETLWAAVYLKNESDRPQTATESWDVFRFVLGEKGERTIYYPAHELSFAPAPPTSIVLSPGEVRTWPTYFDFDMERQARFCQSGHRTSCHKPWLNPLRLDDHFG